MVTRVYIAGKVTGESYDECFAKFVEAEKNLQQNGLQVINPMRMVPENASWEQAMKLCLKSLLTCDIVYLLPDWCESDGAVFEVMVAKRLGINIQMQVPCIRG